MTSRSSNVGTSDQSTWLRNHSLEIDFPVIPERSRLISLCPAAVGTAKVESLCSYVARLAQSHSISVRTLLEKEIFAKPFSPNSFSRFFNSLNYRGNVAEAVIKRLSQLTAQTDIEKTTLFPWRNVLPSIGLLKKTRAWCPLCYEQSRDHAQSYDRLLWTIDVVKICPDHKVPLATSCPICTKRNPHLSNKLQPGYCSWCNEWLGNANVDPVALSHETNFTVWTASEVGKLLAIAPSISEPPASAVRDLVNCCFVRSKYRYERAFARAAGLEFDKIGPWLRGHHSPTLEKQLKLCFHVQLSPAAFFANPSAFLDAESTATPRHYPQTLKATQGLPPQPISATKAKALLDAALTLQPPQPLRALQRSTGWSTRRMKHHFPKVCRTIIRNYQATYKNPVDRSACRRHLELALTDKSTPPLDLVARRANCSTMVLKELFPELAEQILSRHAAKRVKVCREQKLKEAIVQEPPPTLRGLAIELQTTVTALSVKFPTLCEAIGARSRSYRRAEAEKRKKLLSKAVLKTVRDLESKGLYPSVTRVFANVKMKTNPTTVHRIIRANKPQTAA